MRTNWRRTTVRALGASGTGGSFGRSVPRHVALSVSTVTALLLPVCPALADGLSNVKVGAGVRASFDRTDPSAGDAVDDFNLNSVRLYVSGTVTDQISLMFNTEYQGSPPAGDNSVQVLDAVAQFKFSDRFNIWAGRFLPPSDRANMYGPYYANQWGVFSDGVQDGYPSITGGRDNGIAYWGQWGRLKVAAGAFDIPSTTGSSKVVYSSRLQVDLWDPEDSYYLNGTYYGEKDLLALGIAGQSAGGNKAYSADFLLEKKLPGTGGVISVESEYAKYDHFGGYAGDESNGWYALASYLFPQVIGLGKFQVLAKYAHAKYEFDSTPVDDVQTTKSAELNYIIKTFDARISLYYIDFKYDQQIAGADRKQWGVGVQLQL